jgi:replication factor C large subunit
VRAAKTASCQLPAAIFIILTDITPAMEDGIWTVKHSPRNCSEIVGHSEELAELCDFVQNYKKSGKRAAIIFGPTGSGKTCSVHALAKELDLEIFEVNASDVRNKEAMNSLIGSATKQMALFSKGKIILVDEIDGVSGNADRGGILALAALVKESSFPIIMTATDVWDDKFKDLRKISHLVQFKELEHKDILEWLKKISAAENLSVDEEALSSIARRAGSDLRSAVNDLEILSAMGERLSKEDVDELSFRNRTETLLNALFKILKTTDSKVASGALEDVDELIDEVILWLDENLPKEYDKRADLARAYDALSMADVFRGRIRNQQHWRYLVYVNAFSSMGVALSKSEKYKKNLQYNRPMRLLKYWQARMKYSKRETIAAKVASLTHSSQKATVKRTIPYIAHMFATNPSRAAQLKDYFQLDDEESEWLVNHGS